MKPRIYIKVGTGRDPVELQKALDTDLKTTDKTVVGAINELCNRPSEETYDDTELRNKIAEVETLITGIDTRLGEIIEEQNELLGGET